MKKLDLGRIPEESMLKVMYTVKDSDVAISKNDIRTKTGIPTASLNKILEYYVLRGKFRKIDTSNGTFYEWVS